MHFLYQSQVWRYYDRLKDIRDTIFLRAFRHTLRLVEELCDFAEAISGRMSL